MAFTSRRNVANAVQLSPSVHARVVRPYIVKPLGTVGASKSKNLSVLTFDRSGFRISQIEFLLPANNGVIGSGWRYLTFRRVPVITVLYEHFPSIFPSIITTLERVQIKGKKVVEEIAFHLAPKDIYLRAQYVESMPISSCRFRVWGERSRPLACC